MKPTAAQALINKTRKLLTRAIKRHTRKAIRKSIKAIIS